MEPLVAIVGSADPVREYDPPLRDQESAVDAARQIGQELAARSCSIVVHSSSPSYIEAAVVEGYVESGQARPNSIRVVGRYGRQDIRYAGADTHPEYFTVSPDPEEDWEVAYYASLLRADAVLLIGGGTSTFIAGVIAISRRIALAPLPAFGAAGEKVWRRLDAHSAHATREDLARLAQPWQPGSAKVVVDSLLAQHERRLSEDERRERASRQGRRRTTASLVLALVTLLAALSMLPLAYAVQPGTWSGLTVLIAAPVLASICGALVRNALGKGQEWLRSAVIGGVAGSIAFVLFTAGQLATSPDMLSGADVRRLVVIVLLVGFAGGFGSELVYARLHSQDLTQGSPITLT